MSDTNGSTGLPTRRALFCGAVLACVMAHHAALGATWAEDTSPPPTTAAATWQVIDKDLAQLDSLIKAGKIGSLGSSAYGIANAFKLLPAQSAALPADKLAEVQADVKLVGSAVSKLDKAGEKNDAAGLQTNLQALKATLDQVRAYYPK